MAITYIGLLDASNKARSAPSFARRLFNRYIETRQQNANRRVAGYVRGLADGTLERLGYTEAQIRRLRSF